MRRLWSSFSLPRTRLVIIEGLHDDPLPVGDSLRDDLSFDEVAAYFSTFVHQPAEPNAEPQFTLTPSLRALTLMPVTNTANRARTTAWVPFLIEPASPRTYFTGATIEALRLARADHVAIMQKRVLWGISTGHFNDINLLGTDFLTHGELSISYSSTRVDFKFKDPSAAKTKVTDGHNGFVVTPAESVVYSLKEAIKKTVQPKADHVAAMEIIIKDPVDGRAMKSDESLNLGVEYMFEIPPKPKSSLFSGLFFSRG